MLLPSILTDVVVSAADAAAPVADAAVAFWADCGAATMLPSTAKIIVEIPMYFLKNIPLPI